MKKVQDVPACPLTRNESYVYFKFTPHLTCRFDTKLMQLSKDSQTIKQKKVWERQSILRTGLD